VARVRAFEELRVAGRDRAKAEALAEELVGELDLAVSAAASWEEACDGADVVCATTHADEPVVLRDHLSPGTHVTSVGFNPTGREVDDATVADALVAVESRESALAPVPAGSLDLANADPDDVVEIGELLDGRRTGRTSPDELTLYKSVGVAVQDAAAAALVLRAALEQGAGLEVDIQD
jgi:alanine dehydrogenase